MLNLSRIVSKEFLAEKPKPISIFHFLPVSLIICPKLIHKDEIVVQIFLFLTDYNLLKAAIVCKHWYELSNDPQIWQSLYIRRIRLETNAIVSEIKIRNASELQELRELHELELENVIEVTQQQGLGTSFPSSSLSVFQESIGKRSITIKFEA
jgi:hypothetical protein